MGSDTPAPSFFAPQAPCPRVWALPDSLPGRPPSSEGPPSRLTAPPLSWPDPLLPTLPMAIGTSGENEPPHRGGPGRHLGLPSAPSAHRPARSSNTGTRYTRACPAPSGPGAASQEGRCSATACPTAPCPGHWVPWPEGGPVCPAPASSMHREPQAFQEGSKGRTALENSPGHCSSGCWRHEPAMGGPPEGTARVPQVGACSTRTPQTSLHKLGTPR